MNPYLVRLRAQFAAIEQTVNGLMTRAASEDRDLTATELKSIEDQGEMSKTLAEQIKGLEAFESRSASVGHVQAVTQGSGTVEQVAGSKRPTGGATTKDRDPGYYTRSSLFSFVGDQYRAAQMQDPDAKERLTKHTNALRDDEQLRDVLGTGGGVGLVPPVWLAEQFAPILHRRLRVASLLRQIPFSGPFAWSIPVAGAGANTATVAEGVNPTESDPTYSVLTVTPATISGYSEVSRQMLEASNPAVDAVIWGDMLGDYYDDCETAVIAALEAQASVNAITIADGAVALGARNGVLDGLSAVSDNGGGDADLFVGRTARWVSYLKLVDGAGRPLVTPTQRYGPMNATGIGNNTMGFRSVIQGEMEGLAVATSPTVAAARAFIINSQELLFSNSQPVQFKFEQPAGPALIRIGVWGYMAVVTGRRPKAITKITYTAN